MAATGDMELARLADSVGGLMGLGGIFDDMKDIALLGGGATVGFLGMGLAFNKIAFLDALNPYIKGGIAIAAGLAVGVGVGRFVNRGVGAGLGAGMAAWGISKIVQKATGLSLGDAGDEYLLGLGSNTSVEDYNPLPGQTSGITDVEQAADGSWLTN